VYSPTASPPTAPAPTGSDAQRNARYAYLVGRLRSRQITMEEATELFGIMQGLLRTSEAARLAALARVTAAAPPPPAVGPTPSGRMGAPSAPPATTPGDDLFLVGLLTMGAGAGLLAAMARRLSEGPAPAPRPPARTSR
jgi:hypothetical protein